MKFTEQFGSLIRQNGFEFKWRLSNPRPSQSVKPCRNSEKFCFKISLVDLRVYVLFAFTYLLINTLLSKTRHQIQTQARQKLQKCPSQIVRFLFGAFFFFMPQILGVYLAFLTFESSCLLLSFFFSKTRIPPVKSKRCFIHCPRQ